ncbi:MAG: thiamine-phosphate kinase [Candidatus Fermentibacteraceae bacterium]|nr:thiamine-phosphate kinase [Candidatus Fermentibacteraceae bacterium]
MRLLRDVGEHGFIRVLRERFPMQAAGDDAAVLASLETPVVTTDSFFEGTHFYRWWTTPEKTAARLLEATLSDIAAMGGEPRSVLSSIVVSPDMELDWILEFYRGLTSRTDCPVVGGETVKGSVFGVTLTAIGECGGKKPFLRTAVKPGDTLWVTGPVGRALDSPELLEKGRKQQLSPVEAAQTELFLSPVARFDAVPLLRGSGVEAAIDISDGLFSECIHLSRESGVRITVELERVPVVPYALNRAVEACSAGEDFELLFALPRSLPPPGRGFYMVGSATEGKGFAVTEKGTDKELSSQGYDHFTPVN